MREYEPLEPECKYVHLSYITKLATQLGIELGILFVV
jgi:hypothetical protein